MPEKRTTILKGKPVVLSGPEIKVGDKAPNFKLVPPHNRVELSPTAKKVALSQFPGKVRFISVVPSLDTPVCDMSTKIFEQKAEEYPDVAFFTISMDLPFAQHRYNEANAIHKSTVLSDYLDASFGVAYGVLMEKLRLHSRAVFVIDKNDTVRYVQYVPSVSTPPDFDKAIAAVKKLIR